MSGGFDDLEELKRALDAAEPAPDPRRKAEALALAMKNFDARQESAEAARPTSVRPLGGLVRGMFDMIHHISRRGALVASTAVAAFALVALIPVIQDATGGMKPPSVSETRADDPVIVASDAIVASPEPAPPASGADLGVQLEAAPAGQRMAAPQLGKRGPGVITTLDVVSATGEPAPVMLSEGTGESYAEAEPSGVKVTAEEPVSTFSIDVDTASWAILRNFLNVGEMPPAGAVRIEEMVNYFPYAYPAPENGDAFRASVGIAPAPWNAGREIVQIGLQGALPAERPALNLVFLIDTSGSMQDRNKLPLLQQSLRLLLGVLEPRDEVAIVTYAGSSQKLLAPTPASERSKILAAIEGLTAGGGTAGADGLREAYATIAEMRKTGEVSRVVLATDGDFNVGVSDPEELEALIAEERRSGAYLSVLGFGRGNLDDATMQALAQTGNGIAAYIDSAREAQKVLVDEMMGSLVPIADDVKIQVEFNPAQVAEYRLLGYETRALNREDFRNDRVDAGEIGAGHQVTALYEIVRTGSEARMTEPLRYGSELNADPAAELGFLRLRYKAPGEEASRLIETPILPGSAPLPDAGFALAVAGFGELLRGSDFLGDWSYADALTYAQAHRGEDPMGYRQEALGLMRLAEGLSD